MQSKKTVDYIYIVEAAVIKNRSLMIMLIRGNQRDVFSDCNYICYTF